MRNGIESRTRRLDEGCPAAYGGTWKRGSNSRLHQRCVNRVADRTSRRRLEIAMMMPKPGGGEKKENRQSQTGREPSAKERV